LYEKQSGVTRYFKYLLKGRDYEDLRTRSGRRSRKLWRTKFERVYDTEYNFDYILAEEITQIQNGFSCGDKNLILHRFFAEDLEP
jgi:hypothetical protein